MEAEVIALMHGDPAPMSHLPLPTLWTVFDLAPNEDQLAVFRRVVGSMGELDESQALVQVLASLIIKTYMKTSIVSDEVTHIVPLLLADAWSVYFPLAIHIIERSRSERSSSSHYCSSRDVDVLLQWLVWLQRPRQHSAAFWPNLWTASWGLICKRLRKRLMFLTESSCGRLPMDGYHFPNSVLVERGLRHLKVGSWTAQA